MSFARLIPTNCCGDASPQQTHADNLTKRLQRLPDLTEQRNRKTSVRSDGAATHPRPFDDVYQRSMILTHAGDSHGLRIVIHHGELREVLHGGSDRASGRLYGG